jgi:hypothetical protein
MRHFILAVLTLAMILLPAISVQALPSGNQTWTEEPWSPAEAQETIGSGSMILSAPIAFNINGSEPSKIHLGDSEMNFTDYQSRPGLSELWIRKGTSWSQYEQVFQGEDADLIAYTPKDGNVDLYLISYAKSIITHWSFNFQRGYHLLRLAPDEPGRLFLILATDSQPSNALILDVLARPAEQASSPVDVKSVLPGKAKVTIKSERFKGYEVYVNGVFYSSDASDGALDGVAGFTLKGDETHTITISQRDGQGNIINKSEHTRSFKRDTAYTLTLS